MKKSILLALTTTLVFASLSAFAECPGNGTAKDGRSSLESKGSTNEGHKQKPKGVNK